MRETTQRASCAMGNEPGDVPLRGRELPVETLDLRKDLKYLYQPSVRAPVIVEVPEFRFLTVDGIGDIGGPAFQDGISALFSLGYPVRFGAKKQLELEYPVMPLEGLYWNTPEHTYSAAPDAPDMSWKLLMMVPVQVPDSFIEAMRDDVAAKKDLPRLADVRMETFAEGTSVQIMYVGPYADETPTIDRMLAFAAEQGYRVAGAHHEIYIGDPTRAAPEKLRTVLRYPLEPTG